MTTDNFPMLQHDHIFLGGKHDRNERKTWFVVAFTAVMMVVEILGGQYYGSMALVADGWHMSTHAGALMIAGLAYRFARRYAQDPRFTFGTGKLPDLAALLSAMLLGTITVIIAYESFHRLINPVPINFKEATLIATVGLAVNLVSAWMLFDEHHHGPADAHGEHQHDGHAHEEGHSGHHHHHHHDHNLRAAYIHVLADAVTSVLAILGLLAGRYFGWIWMDPLMGLVGATVIGRWSWGLARTSGAILLDCVPSVSLMRQVRQALEGDGEVVTDLHLWRLGPGHLGVVATVASPDPQPSSFYKQRLAGIQGLSHVTIEVDKK